MSRNEVDELEKEIKSLRQTLQQKEELLRKIKNKVPNCPYSQHFASNEVTRYSRQMIMDQIQVKGQLAMKQSKILVVGAGGLGCPASLYLAAAGIGELHIMDYDEVELSNLHRQILHSEADIGVFKAQSACEKLQRINSNITLVPLQKHADTSLVDIILKHKYNVVLDCTDNVPTRYLLNDICVLHSIPLVSGSALQLEGQLTVYNYKNGPCYRCLFPVPPPPDAVTNCGDGGVLGAVPGVIGVLQALEAIKIVTEHEGVLSGRLLIFDGSDTVFRNIKLRQKVANCDVCGNSPKITSPINYEQFCGAKAHDKVVNIDVLQNNENISAEKLTDLLGNSLVVDVRPELEFDMCRLPHTINLPYSCIKEGKGLQLLEGILINRTDNSNVYVLCRRGNDSQRSIQWLKQHFHNQDVKFINVTGGLAAFANKVDISFPIY